MCVCLTLFGAHKIGKLHAIIAWLNNVLHQVVLLVLCTLLGLFLALLLLVLVSVILLLLLLLFCLLFQGAFLLAVNLLLFTHFCVNGTCVSVCLSLFL